MVARPHLGNVWATTADITDIIDPDLDVAHPSGRGGAGRYALGWEATPIKQPHEWANFLGNKLDETFKQQAERGFLLWEDDIAYVEGSIVYHGSSTYIAKQASTNQLPTNTTYWLERTDDIAAINAAVASLHETLDDHVVNYSNEHATHVHDLVVSGYTTTEIDALIASGLQDVLDHIALTNNPHQVTPTQLGVLPVTGGIFTGQVDYRYMAFETFTLDASANVGGGAVGFHDNTNGLALNYDEEPVEVIGNDLSLLLHEGNYYEMRNRAEPSFVLPVPQIEINFLDGINTKAVGAYTLTYTRAGTLSYVDKEGNAQTAIADEPAIEKGGLKLDATYSLQTDVDIQGASVAVTYADGSKTLGYTGISNPELRVHLGTTGVVTSLRIFSPRLTTEQEAML